MSDWANNTGKQSDSGSEKKELARKTGARTPRTQLTLDDAEWAELKQICEYKSIPVATFVRSVVLQSVKTEVRAIKNQVKY